MKVYMIVRRDGSGGYAGPYWDYKAAKSATVQWTKTPRVTQSTLEEREALRKNKWKIVSVELEELDEVTE